MKNDYLGSKLFTEKANTLLRAEMGRKSKLNKYLKMPTEGKYWELISKIVIEFLVLNSAKRNLSFFILAESFYPTQYFRMALYYQTSGASGNNFFPSVCLKTFSSIRRTY